MLWPWISSSARSRSRCAPRLTGSTASPGIFEVMAVLGRDEALARIADAVESRNAALQHGN